MNPFGVYKVSGRRAKCSIHSFSYEILRKKQTRCSVRTQSEKRKTPSSCVPMPVDIAVYPKNSAIKDLH